MFYDLFAMDASTDGLVVVHGHCCYVICATLVVEAAVKTFNELCYVCDFSDARRKIPGVTTNF